MSHLARPVVPSTLLLPDFTVASFSTLENVDKVKHHTGSSLMFIFLSRNKPPDQMLQEIKLNLQNFEEQPLHRIGFLLFEKKEEIELLDSIKDQVENLGIKNFKVANSQNQQEFTKVLQAFQQESESVDENRCFRDFRQEKVKLEKYMIRESQHRYRDVQFFLC